MAGSHGFVRGLHNVSSSSISGARFGRMFRTLPRETYDKGDLLMLSKELIQLETAHLRTSADPDPDEFNTVREGPDAVEGSVPFNRLDDPNTLLDTQYGEPEPPDENPTLPAGYTYFGQFIDHDLTFDPNSSLQKLNDPDATEDFRTPRFDLDSLYGRGPDDQPYLYKNAQRDGGGIRMLSGRNPDDSERRGELPRNVEGRALIGDPRNDENALVCQIQAIFLNFHNKVADTLLDKRQMSFHDAFVEAQRIVRWHYQYLVLNDYLARIVGAETWNKVFIGTGTTDRPEPKIDFYVPHQGQAYMPVEFSVAAFRFGHSMVRPSYALRADDPRVGGGDASHPFAQDNRFHRIPIFSNKGDPAANLSGFGPLPPGWEIDWDLFFAAVDMPTETYSDGVLGVSPQDATHRTQPGYRIDTSLADPLAMLPPTVAKSGNMPDGIRSLAYRNLVRGSEFELPSGQSVARALNIEPLTESDLWETAKSTELSNRKTNPFAFRAPLWFYILKEAEFARKAGVKDKLGGHHMGPVGGTIVAEVLVGIALNDHMSYLFQDPSWTPEGEKTRSGFDPGPNVNITTVYDLIHWTTNGTMSLA